LRFLLTAFIAGESLLLFLPELPSTEVWAAFSISISICLLLIFFLRNKSFLITKQDQDTNKQKEYLNLLAGVLLIGFLGFSWSGYLTHERLQRSLNSELEGIDLLVTGIVDGLPSQNTEGIRFSIQVESVELEVSEQQVHHRTAIQQIDHQASSNLIDIATFPKRLSLGWYAGWGGKVQLPEIKPGQRWQLPVRLKKPHGLMNPHGFDFERWMFQQDLGANGSVRAGAKGLPSAWKPKLLDEFSASFKTYVELTRWHLRERIKAGAPDGATYVGVLIALVMGEQNAIAQSDWRVFNATGIGHLIRIKCKNYL
jgi:competence protein ComEC